MFSAFANNPITYTDPDGREIYSSETLTEDIYKSNSQLQRQFSWEYLQAFFEDNPNGIVYRYDTVSYSLGGSKNSFPNMEKPNVGLVEILILVKGLFGGLGTTVNFSLSKKPQKHILTRHSLNGMRNKASHMTEKQIESMISKKTIFNPKWSDEKILKVVEKGVKSALKSGITDNKYIYKYFGEEIIIEMDKGFPQTAYGIYKVTKDMLK